MINRKQVELDRFKEEIDRVWKLSIVEQDVLCSFLNLFLAGKNTEIKKVEYLLENEIEDLLNTLNERDLIRYAERNLDMIDAGNKDGLEEALDDLNFRWVNKVSDKDMIKSLENDGWSVEFDYNYPRHQADIVTQSDLEEMTELFLNLSQQKRSEMINNLKNV